VIAFYSALRWADNSIRHAPWRKLFLNNEFIGFRRIVVSLNRPQHAEAVGWNQNRLKIGDLVALRKPALGAGSCGFELDFRMTSAPAKGVRWPRAGLRVSCGNVRLFVELWGFRQLRYRLQGLGQSRRNRRI